MTNDGAADPLFTGGGELGRAMAAHDWTASPLGPSAGWPVELRTAVRILLTSRFSMWMAWGPDLTMFYNDAYLRDTLRAKHPWALGRSSREVWAEIWHDIGPRIDSVLATGEATWDEALLLFLERAGYREESYHTFSYSPLADGDGTVVGMLCVVSEDTERVIGERRLRVLSELGDVSAVTAPTPQEACVAAVRVLAAGRIDVPFAAVYLLDDGGDVARRVADHGLREGQRFLPERTDGTEKADLWSALDPDAGPTVVEGIAADLVSAPGAHPGGDLAPDQAVIVPLTGAGGEPTGMLVLGVSPFRALDAEYHRFLDLVARGVAAAVADAQAYQTERTRADRLAELDRAKTEFFTGVSHELRTPLTLIAGPAEDALADTTTPLAAAQRLRLELILRNSGRLRRLVDTLLEFSRLESGAARPERVAVDLAALTRGITESFAPAVTRAGLGLTVDCPGPLPASVDPSMWEKILLNLLSNAVKYTVSGGLTVQLAKGDGVTLSVTDTGIGVPPADRPLLFQRFHRVAGATGRSHEGSGIGLALVAELAALHGGTAAVDEARGGGSVFTVTLPPDALVATPAVPSGRAPSTAALLYRDEALQWSGAISTGAAEDEPDLPRADPGATAGATVLVAEDNADLRRFLAGLLAPHYRVLLAADGGSALQLARTERPDLVLTDVMMPALDGFGLLAALRSHPASATIPVVLLSARAGEGAAIEGLAAGADDYLVKPFSSADLLARVRSNLQLARVRNHEAAWRTALIQSLQDGLFVLDGDGAVQETNQAFLTMVGYGVEDMPYAVPHPWWPDAEAYPEDAATVRAAFERMLADGRGAFLVPLRHRDGRRILAEISVESVGTGPARRFVGTANDVTERRRVADRDRLLADTGRLLAQPIPLSRLLDELVAAIVPVLGRLVAVLLTGPDGRQSVAAAAHSRSRARAGIVRGMGTVPALHERLREPYARGDAFVAPPGTCALARELGRHDGTEPGESLMVPLAHSGRVLGTLVICDAPAVPDAMDLATAEELGRRLATAIHTRRAAERERRLHELTAALAAAGTVAVAARVFAAGLVGMTGASGVTALLRRPDGGLDVVHRHGAPRDPDTGPGSPAAAALVTGQAQWLRDEGAAVLPLAVGDRVTGLLAVTFPGHRAFDEDDRVALRSLAGEAALAFERAALADARRDLAETLQQSLLPAALPEHERLQLTARYLPAAAGGRTGGDWYDVLVREDQRVAIVVGDVVGQGPAAAAVMGQLRSALSAYLLRAGSPAEALQWLDTWSHRVQGARASTVVCVVLDVFTGDLWWARAGHPPPLVVAAGGGSRYLDGATGAVLGVRGAPPFTDGQDRLEPGDTVLLFTDGLVERRGEIVDAGLDRLTRAVADGGPLDVLVPAVLHAALDDAGPPDDVALVGARWRPAGLVDERPAVPATLGAVRRAVAGWARETGLGENHTDDLQLAVGEAVANAVEHAYAGREPGPVRYRLVRTPLGVLADIADDGRWRPPGDPGFRGRGLAVISKLGTDVTVEHGDGGTHVRFLLPAPDEEPAAPPGPDAPEPAAVDRPAHLVAVPGTLHLTGDLDLAAVPGVREDALAAVGASSGPLVVDLTGVTHLASAGVGLLAELLDAGAGRIRLRVAGTGPVGRVLDLTGLGRHVEPRTPAGVGHPPGGSPSR